MKHLNRSQRDQLQALFRAGHKQETMADIIGCSQPTISRELKRNNPSVQSRYTALTAQKKVEERKKRAKEAYPLWHADKELLDHVLSEFAGGKSPEQVMGRRKYMSLSHISQKPERPMRWSGPPKKSLAVCRRR